MSRPTVSIIVPTYNREALLPRALDSILAQTFDDWEIVLVDDGSTDGTKSLAAGYAKRLGERFVCIHRSNTGCCGARNRGIDASRGRFVAFLDSDDEFLPTKLERQLALFERRPELGLVYSDFAYVDTDGKRAESAFDTMCPLARQVPYETVAPGLCVCTESLFDTLIRGNFIATIVGMVRREVLGRQIRFGPDPSYSAEWLFYLRAARICRAGFVNEPLSLHRHMQGSVTRTDTHRNTVRYRDLLKAIEASFDDLNHEHRKAIHRNLAHTCRQLGYDAWRAGRYRDAALSFAESLHYKPGARAFKETVQAATCWLLAGSGDDRSAECKRAKTVSEAVR